MLKAIIFDMDGTLADTEDIHRLAFNEAFSEFDFDWRWSVEEYKKLLSISGGKERIRIDLEQRTGSSEKDEDMWHLSEAVHRRKSEIYRDMLLQGDIALRDGVDRLIQEAHARKIILAIATSSSRKNVETLLGNALGENALDLFPVIVTSDIVEDKKPSPVVYQFTLAKLGLDPRNCVAIEDTFNGNRAAIGAELKTVITTHVYTWDDDFSGASLVVDRLGEPGQPFSSTRGDTHGKQLVDVDLLQLICRENEDIRNSETWLSEHIALAAS